MRETIRGIGGVLAFAAASWIGVAAAEEKKPDADTKAEARAEADDDAVVIAPQSVGCCDRPALVPVCRCVPTTKKRQRTEYDVKCELVCVPGCSRHLFGTRHGGCPGGCSDGAGCCGKPCCDHATIRPKKTLLKKVVDEEEVAWEYEVEWVCAGCGTGRRSDDGCAGRMTPPAKHGASWHAFHDFYRRLFHRK